MVCGHLKKKVKLNVISLFNFQFSQNLTKTVYTRTKYIIIYSRSHILRAFVFRVMKVRT